MKNESKHGPVGAKKKTKKMLFLFEKILDTREKMMNDTRTNQSAQKTRWIAGPDVVPDRGKQIKSRIKKGIKKGKTADEKKGAHDTRMFRV